MDLILNFNYFLFVIRINNFARFIIAYSLIFLYVFACFRKRNSRIVLEDFLSNENCILLFISREILKIKLYYRKLLVVTNNKNINAV